MIASTASTASIVGGIGIAALAFAWWVQTHLGIVPCELCLLERWPYRIAIGLSVVALIASTLGCRGIGMVVLAALMLVFVGATALAFVHVGVEQSWWQSPFPECRAERFIGGSFTDQIASMPAHPAKPCDAATYLVPHLPLSMAALNLLLSLCVFAFLARSLMRTERGRRW